MTDRKIKIKSIIQFLREFLSARSVIISLFDYSGAWSEPYRRSGCRVLQVDTKLGFDVFAWNYEAINPEIVAGILAAPPCDHFSVSGSQYWSQKDKDGRTKAAIKLVRRTLEVINYFKPLFWAMENPVGRLNKLVPELANYGPWYFQPYWYGDPWSKKTGLWGKYNRPKPDKVVKPCKASSQGSWVQGLGGKSEQTKELRSITPPGFAKAFYQANPVAVRRMEINRAKNNRGLVLTV